MFGGPESGEHLRKIESQQLKKAMPFHRRIAKRDILLYRCFEREAKKGYSTVPVSLAGLEVAARIQGRGSQRFLSATEYHRMECREQGCVAGP